MAPCSKTHLLNLSSVITSRSSSGSFIIPLILSSLPPEFSISTSLLLAKQSCYWFFFSPLPSGISTNTPTLLSISLLMRHFSWLLFITDCNSSNKLVNSHFLIFLRRLTLYICRQCSAIPVLFSHTHFANYLLTTGATTFAQCNLSSLSLTLSCRIMHARSRKLFGNCN